jgi:hypothetical protein
VKKISNLKREKDFGIVFSIIFFLLSLYSLIFNQGNYILFFFFIFLLFIAGTYIKPRWLRIPSILWLDFAKLISKFTNPIIFGLIFYVILSPIGIIFRIFNIDLLNQKINKNIKTYWEQKKIIKTSVKNQY